MRNLIMLILTLVLVFPATAQQNPYRVTDLNPSTNLDLGYPMAREVMNGWLYFSMNDGTGVHLWRTNGIVTEKIHDIQPLSSMSAIGNLLYFCGNDSHGWEPWRSDGTTSGTFLLKDVVRRGTPSIDIAGLCFTEMGGDVYFTMGSLSTSGFIDYLLRTNGSSSGTKTIASHPGFISLSSIGSELIIDAVDLWKSDGTSKGTVELVDICSSFPVGSNCHVFPYQDFGDIGNYNWLRHPIVVNGIYYNTLLDDDNGNELWRSDGTVAGTYQLTDINPGSGSSYPSHIVRMGNHLYFAAYDDAHGMELWRYPLNGNSLYDATLVADINPGPGNSEPVWLTAVGNSLYFSAYEPETGRELWTCDGSSVRRVKDINPGGESSDPFFTNHFKIPIGMSHESSLKHYRSFTVIDGTLYFSANNGTTGHELWRSDGTEAGTELIADINTSPGDGSWPRYMIVLDGKLFFMAYTPQDGNEWWVYYPGGNIPPIASANASPTSGTAPLNVSFSSTGSYDPDGTITSWYWEFGDGSTSTLPDPSHTYQDEGTYTARLTVTDDQSATATDKVTISVLPMADYLHVADQTVTRVSAPGNKWEAQDLVLIKNTSGQVVSGAVVTAFYTGPTTGSATGTTGADGTVTLISERKRNPSGTWCFTVTDVQASGYLFNDQTGEPYACEVVPKRGALAPQMVLLEQNFPNPFSAGGASTLIRYCLPRETEVALRVYDVFGREVARLESGTRTEGAHEVRFDGSGLASGFYIYRLDTEGKSIIRRMILAK